MDYYSALTIVCLMIDAGIPDDEAIHNPAIPAEHRCSIKNEIDNDCFVIIDMPAAYTPEASFQGQ
jgi:hypothetical protein